MVDASMLGGGATDAASDAFSSDQSPYAMRRRLRHNGRRVASGADREPLFLDVAYLSWEAEAACVGTDPDAFFPEGPVPPAVRQMCQTCPVYLTCLEFAVARPELAGVWGGTTGEDRKKIRRRGQLH